MEYPELFRVCLDVVLKSEGGYSNHPKDKGGATNMGITQSVYNDYREEKRLPFQDVKNITIGEVQDIYYSKYWKLMKLDPIKNKDLVLRVFDMGITSGPATAIKLLQRVVHVTDDGVLGPISLRAVNEHEGDIVKEYDEKRKLFYILLVQRKPDQRVFLKGWINRVNNTHF